MNVSYLSLYAPFANSASFEMNYKNVPQIVGKIGSYEKTFLHHIVKSNSHLPKNLFYFLQLKPSKIDVKWCSFHCILKALLVIKIFEFLSWLFDHIENMTSVVR